MFLFLANSTCNPSEFKCDGRKCLSNSKRCDGVVDCRDYTDEKNCRKFLIDQYRSTTRYCGVNQKCSLKMGSTKC